jgi:hypothetical protein
VELLATAVERRVLVMVLMAMAADEVKARAVQEAGPKGAEVSREDRLLPGRREQESRCQG